MNEKTNAPAKWLQQLLYVGIAAMANSVLAIFLPSGLTRWIGIAVNALTVYLLFMLAESNPRYKTAAIFYGVALVGGFISHVIMSLAASVCGIVAQYQEYHAHGELIEERDPKLADKWGTLFGLQLAASIVLVLLSGLIAGFLVAADIGQAVVTALVTVIAAAVAVCLRGLYLMYLKRSINLLETETVV